MKGIDKMLKRLLTKNLTEIPLFWVVINYKKYQEDGAKGSAMAHRHPILKDDEYIKTTLNELIDHIRNNYDVNEL